MSEIRSHRRRLLLMSFDAHDRAQHGLQRALLGQQQALAGTPISPTTPAYSKLAAANYLAREDIDGATLDELTRYAGVTRQQAAAAFAALGLTPASP